MTTEQKPISCIDKAKGMLMRINPMTWFSKEATTPTPQPSQPAQPQIFQPSPQTNTQIQPIPQLITPEQPPKLMKRAQLRFQNKQNSDIPEQNNQDQSKSKQPSDSY